MTQRVVHSKAQLDLTNIESIFATFDIANILGKLPGNKKEEIPKIINSLKEVIVKTLEETMEYPLENKQIKAPHPYGDFDKLIKHLHEDAFPRHTSSVITFNYDIAADMALFWEGLGPDYGMGPIPGSLIPLLKLHGSLNWASQKDSGGIYPIDLKDYLNKYKVDFFSEATRCKVPIGSHIKGYFRENPNVKVEPEPVIVPPTWNKAGHHRALSKVWANAAHHLGEAEHLFIIGYSLPQTDLFFRLLYALGTVGGSPLKNIIVYNPDNTGEVDARFKEMLGPGAISRYQYKSKTFEAAIEDIESYFPSRN